ncbi:MAG: acetyl-CoA carboxylase biotin carboxyl carrier protein subunit [Odoribacter sp.]|nr:acetyl-CoA carboxylase biotin carboxyl carrier protein subunit [Odoribacter sp.]
MTEKFDKFMLNGVEYKTRLTQKWINRKKWEEPNPYLLCSHIPGTIMQIEVKEGQSVEEGATLLILQAMKMNNKLTAPFSGKIKKINVCIGDKIPKGALMIEMEEN